MAIELIFDDLGRISVGGRKTHEFGHGERVPSEVEMLDRDKFLRGTAVKVDEHYSEETKTRIAVYEITRVFGYESAVRG